MFGAVDPRFLELMVPRVKLVFNAPIFVWLTEVKAGTSGEYYYESWSPLLGTWKEGRSINEAIQAQEDYLKGYLSTVLSVEELSHLSFGSAIEAVKSNGPYVMVSWRTIEIEIAGNS
jgi:hypothetical protein